ncbi:interferon regulatory factor 4-like isoform X2 [Lethenteron reissneri]|uniref:interferon regulatory factor 4-like isoform X2 n=1 Tax=Lethenteron reissneri TaxID=7753 RepID=UPI002AB6E7F9|nr:interferon regulatory factor 4-like isoform X2 [Lethenteron reissneri]
MDRLPSAGGSKRLRPWLLEQIESGLYPGLRWEDDSKATFRIPWKHAAKHDYCQQEDAALFKGWALFKGKFRQGDRADPPAWKTRLRCALNKSSDFEEVSERSQLDISEPYKVYRVLPEGSRGKGDTDDDDDVTDDKMNIVNTDAYSVYRRTASNRQCHKRHSQLADRSPWHSQHANMFAGQMKNIISNIDPGFYEMDVLVKYKDERVLYARVSHPLGCRLAFNAGAQAGYDPLTAMLHFPHPAATTVASALASPQQQHQQPSLFYPGRHGELLAAALGSLGRGLTLRVDAALGRLQAERLCRGRVYWSGPCAPTHSGRPNKMERRAAVTLFDRDSFMRELHNFTLGGPEPQTEIVLCFCEEYPGGNLQKKLITAHVSETGNHHHRGQDHHHRRHRQRHHRPHRHYHCQYRPHHHYHQHHYHHLHHQYCHHQYRQFHHQQASSVAVTASLSVVRTGAAAVVSIASPPPPSLPSPPPADGLAPAIGK